MSDSIKQFTIAGTLVPFTFYDAAVNVPVADIGVVFASALRAERNCVIGDTGDAFTVYMQNGGWPAVLSLTFTSMSFMPVPENVQVMQRLQYHRFHAVLMDVKSLRQISIPFNVPDNLLYDHERMAWGERSHGWGGPVQQTMDEVNALVTPVDTWMSVVGFG